MDWEELRFLIEESMGIVRGEENRLGTGEVVYAYDEFEIIIDMYKGRLKSFSMYTDGEYIDEEIIGVMELYEYLDSHGFILPF